MNSIEKILQLLNTINESLTYLENTENAELSKTVELGRRAVEDALYREKGQLFERQVHLSALSDSDWLSAMMHILTAIENPFVPQNTYDQEFLSLLNYVWSNSETMLVKTMKKQLDKMKNDSLETCDGFVSYFQRFPLWGSFSPQQGDYTTFEMRAAVLKRHSYDFLWLYQKLSDYLSKRTLTAILYNWAVLDLQRLSAVKSVFYDYWEPDLFPDNHNDVLVDVGAYNGDSIGQYVDMYGLNYKKIYAYEISKCSCTELKKNIEKWKLHDVIIQHKGVGREPGVMYVQNNEKDSSANHLSFNGEEPVQVIRLDDDTPDATFIKMDIEGAEQDALLGCEQIIRKNHPKLAICVYHGYEDIWKIPTIIERMHPSYRFWLRHNGGNLIPTEFVLLCRD